MNPAAPATLHAMDQGAARHFRQALEQELQLGCHDTAVTGGIEQWSAQHGAPFPRVQQALRAYSGLNGAQRGVQLRAALRMLPFQDNLLTEPGAALPQPPPVVPAHVDALREIRAEPPQDHWPLDTPLERFDFRPHQLKQLASLGRRTLRDVLHTYPARHEDRRVLSTLRGLPEKERATVQGTVLNVYHPTTVRGVRLTVATLLTDTHQTVQCSWFNQPYVTGRLNTGQQVLVTGRVKLYAGKPSLTAEHLETQAQSETQDSAAGRIVSVYPAKDGVNQDLLRRAARLALERHSGRDHLTPRWRERYALAPLHASLSEMHCPSSEGALLTARTRLTFDEYLFLELRMLLRAEGATLHGTRFEASQADVDTFEAALPFRFTGAQRRVIGEITADMRRDDQMARMVQGDVGSGKTAVAACALYLAVRGAHQGALMAPTEILARQHHAGLSSYLGPLGVRVGLLLGAMTPKQKKAVQAQMGAGDLDVVVGTQALISGGVRWNSLGLVVIDEEHRFGVAQRRSLLTSRPDLLVMSATPIPRSLALTSYGDLDISVIDELPPGRTPVTTRIVTRQDRPALYAALNEDVNEGRQVYVVTPLIEENETLDLQAATELAALLTGHLPGVRVALLHGRMASADKARVMADFREHRSDLLVSTTVIEVGVDVPNATVMVIENAERFGLAQLHQLRGRVGRSALQSRCYLTTDQPSAATLRRLRVIESSNDGFVIAEADLKLRGPGELRGTRQSGADELQLGNLQDDEHLIVQARELAQYLLAHDPGLTHPGLARLRAELQARSESVAYRQVI